MKYPKANNYLVYKKVDDDRCRIRDYSDDKISSLEVDMKTAHFLRRLDGKTSPMKCMPGTSAEEVREMLRMLKRNGLLRTKKRVIWKGIGSVEVTLWIPGMKFQKSIYPKIFNWMLLLTWLPLLCAGLFLFLKDMGRYVERMEWVDFQILMGFIAGMLWGMLFHEIAHGSASMSYGVKVFELGIFLDFFMPGAYAALDVQLSKNRWHRIQILGAGVEANFWIGGCCLVLGRCFPALGCFFMMSAICNILLGMSNICLWRLVGGADLDGMLIFSEILGVDNFLDKARIAVFNKRKRREIRAKLGMSGYALIFVYRVIFLFQVLFPVSLVANLAMIAM